MGGAPSPKGAKPPPQFSAHFYCGQTAGCIKMQLGMEVDLSPGEYVLDKDPAPSPKRGLSSPIFASCLLRPNVWMHQDASWYGDRPQPRRLCVRWGPSFLSPKGAQSPQFSANVRCGQTTGWTEMALGMEVGLGPDDFVFELGTQLPPEQRAHPPPPSFWPMFIVAKRLDG